MFDRHHDDMNFANHSNDPAEAPRTATDYLAQARAAKAVNPELAMHLYLGAYEALVAESPLVPDDALEALREAWNLACSLKERSIAEYAYDKLEPHLSDAELEDCNAMLQELAFDKATEFGFSRDELERISDIISGTLGEAVDLESVSALSLPDGAVEAMAEGLARLAEAADEHAMRGEDGSATGNAQASDLSDLSSTAVGPDGPRMPADGAPQPEGSASDESAAGPSRPKVKIIAAKAASSRKGSSPKAEAAEPRHPNFSDLVGYDGIIEDVRSLGIGIEHDEAYQEIMGMLRECHGLDGLSAVGSIVLRASARSDAAEFMEAAANEVGLPAMRMRIQSGSQGFPVLSFTVSADRSPRFAPGRMTVESPSVLILEDIDLWLAPMEEAMASSDDDAEHSLPMPMQIAYQTLMWLRAAIESPDVHVFASIGGETNDSGFLYDLLEPIDVIDIYLPDESERRRIWRAIAQRHPSIRGLDFGSLTRMSRNLARTDIVMAAREALEDAYRQGMRARRYIPVTQAMMYEHLASFQPLDSVEYRQMESAVLHEFRDEIAALEQEVGRTSEDGFGSDQAGAPTEGL